MENREWKIEGEEGAMGSEPISILLNEWDHE
jgi:hypothetical protein